jgi:hypothetical protein
MPEIPCIAADKSWGLGKFRPLNVISHEQTPENAPLNQTATFAWAIMR